jgi:hypothetical protein
MAKEMERAMGIEHIGLSLEHIGYLDISAIYAEISLACDSRTNKRDTSGNVGLPETKAPVWWLGCAPIHILA